MAVSANDNLGGCVIQLRLYLIDIVQKNYRGFQGYRPFQKVSHAGSLYTCTLIQYSLISNKVK